MRREKLEKPEKIQNLGSCGVLAQSLLTRSVATLEMGWMPRSREPRADAAFPVPVIGCRLLAVSLLISAQVHNRLHRVDGNDSSFRPHCLPCI
jgi:hypothetical protein